MKRIDTFTGKLAIRLGLGTALTTLVLAASAQNQVANGSFEFNTCGNGSFLMSGCGTAWSNAGSPLIAENVSTRRASDGNACVLLQFQYDQISRGMFPYYDADLMAVFDAGGERIVGGRMVNLGMRVSNLKNSYQLNFNFPLLSGSPALNHMLVPIARSFYYRNSGNGSATLEFTSNDPMQNAIDNIHMITLPGTGSLCGASASNRSVPTTPVSTLPLLLDDDNSTFNIGSGTQVAADLYVVGQVASPTSPFALRWRAKRAGGPTVYQIAHFYDFVNRKWWLVDGVTTINYGISALPTSETLFGKGSPATNPGRFIEPGTNRVLARISWSYNNGLPQFGGGPPSTPFMVNVDEAMIQ